MFSGNLVPTDRIENILKSINYTAHPPQEVQFTFCVMSQKALKVILDYNPMGDLDLSRWNSGWQFDTIGHIKNGEIYYRGDEIQIIIEIFKRRHVRMNDGRIMIEEYLHPYMLQLSDPEDRTCLGFTLEHFEDMGLLSRMDIPNCESSRGV